MMVKRWIFDGTNDKKRLASRLITTVTVLLLIFAGSPFADMSANTAGAETNPYTSTGTIVVNTDNTAATFNISGPATYSGSGTSWSQADAPTGTYAITFDPIPGYDTPSSDTQNLVSGGTITFTGLYDISAGTITVTTNNDLATFTIAGPSGTTYSGGGTSWSQSNTPLGDYTITYDSITGYDTPPSSSQTLVNSGGTITFTGTYTKTIYTVTLQASEDAYISEQNKNNNYGDAQDISVQSYKTQQKGRNMRSLVKFDTSSLPASSTIISATLSINTKDVPAATRNYTINEATAIWNELSVTWSNKPAVATTETSFANTPPLPGWMSWTVTTDVQTWVNGNSNYGWQISDQSENSLTQYTTTFYTKEDSNANLRPELVVQYTIN